MLTAARTTIPRIASSSAPKALATSIRGFTIGGEYAKKVNHQHNILT